MKMGGGRYQCTKGCIHPMTAPRHLRGKAKWHNNTSECPQEPDYGKREAPPAPEVPQQKIPAQPRIPTAPPPVLRPGTSPLTSRSQPAEVLKAPAVPLQPVEVDYILDGPHVKTLWTVSLSGVYQVHKIEADWFQVAALSSQQFALSDLAITTIEMDPRNFYARTATWLCKRAGCKTLQQAQSFVATVEFGAGFGGLFVALAMWHIKAVRTSPRFEDRRKKKKERMEQKARERAAAIAADSKDLGPVLA